ncbi:MAG: hypothetical protein WBX25_17260 [Rhodomicrobium sp.]
MEQPSTISKLRLSFAGTALLGSIALASVGFSQAANADSSAWDPLYFQEGPYHENVLPNGTTTGPIAPEADEGPNDD